MSEPTVGRHASVIRSMEDEAGTFETLRVSTIVDGEFLKRSGDLIVSDGTVLTSSAALTDNMIVRGDGGAEGVQTSLVEIDDNGRINFSVTGQTFGSTVANGASNVGFQFTDTIARTSGDFIAYENSAGNKVIRFRGSTDPNFIIGTAAATGNLQINNNGLKFGVSTTGTGTASFELSDVGAISGGPEFTTTTGMGFYYTAGEFIQFFGGTDAIELYASDLTTIVAGITSIGEFRSMDTSQTVGERVKTTFTSNPAITADHTLTINIADGDRTLKLAGNATFPSGSAYTPTNVTTDRAYNANATSIDELADVLGTLIADLQTAGVIT